jgi:hypothetical protein
MTAETKFPVRLTEAEALLVSTMAGLSSALAKMLGDAPPPRPELSLSLDEIDDLVERLRDEVVVSGFDANYALNERGRILDGLADKLFARFLASDTEQR